MYRSHWRGISVVLLVLTIIYTSQASTCPETVYEFYEAAGCKKSASNPISGCITEYDCSMIKKTSRDQCFRRGKIYDAGTILPSGREYCDFSCRCRAGQFSCAVVDCPEPPKIPRGCNVIYGDECCESSIVCKADAKYTCTFNNVTYLPKQFIDMDKQRCTRCKCEEGFKGVVEAPYCSRLGCKYQSGAKYYETLSMSCAPFYVVDSCCPVTTACADGTEVIKEKKPKPEGELTCKFGNHTITTSDEVIVKNPSPAVCKCIVPPLLTCNSQLGINAVGYSMRL